MAATELLERHKARDSLLGFAKYTQPDYIIADHIEKLAAKLEAVERGELKRLIVVMPPRHGKSELSSLKFPCWYMGRNPKDYVVQAGYAESIALTHSRKARDIFVSREMTRAFPEVHHRPERAGQETIVPERQAAHEWGTKQGGSYYAVGIGGGLTGRGFNLGIIDDPVKDSEEAESQTYRERAWEWYTKVFFTRCAPGAAIIIIMTRWHEDDLVGRLLKLQKRDPEADQWEVLHFSAISKDEDGIEHALWPERYPVSVLKKIRSGQADNPEEPGQGSRAFESLYQGNPTIAEGQIFVREWWRFYSELPQFSFILQSWDTAFKAKEQNSWSVCTTWGRDSIGYYLIDVWRKKVQFPELKRAAIALHDKYHPNVVIVEDKASGQSLVQELQRLTRIPVLVIKVDRDKVARAYAVTPTIESGRVYLPESAEWMVDYIEELSGFPNATHDDQVDSTTLALSYLKGGMPEDAVIVYDSMELVPNMDLN